MSTVTNKELLTFIQSVRNDKSNSFDKKQIGQIKEANDDRGNSYDGYKVFIDNFSINHIFIKHGLEGSEGNRGQLAIIDDDFIMLLDTIPEITEFTFEGKTKIGREVIMMKKTNGITYFFLFEIRPKYKNLFVKTMFKRRNRI